MGKPKKTTEQCVEDFIKVHGSSYDYHLVDYKASKTKVKIVCKKHGVFEQTPNNHLNGQQCPQCRGVKKKTTEECIQGFRLAHGGLYDYSLVQYDSSKTKVKIICKEHGVFEQAPNNHLNGQGCPKCARAQASTGIYLIKCLETGLTKIGISYSAFKRAADIAPISTLEILYWKDLKDAVVARQVETYLHQLYTLKQCPNPRVRSGNTEFFDLQGSDIAFIKNYIESIASE